MVQLLFLRREKDELGPLMGKSSPRGLLAVASGDHLPSSSSLPKLDGIDGGGSKHRLLPRRMDSLAAVGIGKLLVLISFGFAVAYLLMLGMDQRELDRGGVNSVLDIRTLPQGHHISGAVQRSSRRKDLEERLGVFIERSQDAVVPQNRVAPLETTSGDGKASRVEPLGTGLISVGSEPRASEVSENEEIGLVLESGQEGEEEQQDRSQSSQGSSTPSATTVESGTSLNPTGSKSEQTTKSPISTLVHNAIQKKRNGTVGPKTCPELEKQPPEDFSPLRPPRRHYPAPTSYDRGVCSCTGVANFVILSMQRSGSGWFETLLNSHPNVTSHGEVFIQQKKREKFEDVKEQLDWIYNLEKAGKVENCTAAVGLKWMLNQGSMQHKVKVAEYFREKDVGVILLLRRNPLRRLISILANIYDRKKRLVDGKHKSHVHSKEEAEKLAEFKPKLNIQNLESNLMRVQKIGEDAKKAFASTRMMLLYYEDVMRDPQELQRVQEFVGVPVHQLQSKQVKIHTKPLSEHVSNWPDVAAALRGTQFEEFLEGT